MTESETKKTVAELRVLYDAATPRPWYSDDDGCFYADADPPTGNAPIIEPSQESICMLLVKDDDADLICAAVNNLGTLLDAADALKELLDSEEAYATAMIRAMAMGVRSPDAGCRDLFDRRTRAIKRAQQMAVKL